MLLNFYSVTNITFHVEFQIILWQNKTKRSWIEYYRKGFQRSYGKMWNLTLSSRNLNKKWLGTMTSVCASLLVSFNFLFVSGQFTVVNWLCIMHAYLLYKHQWNTTWAFPWKLHIFTREDNMLSSPVKRSPSLWLHNKSRLWKQADLVFHWCLYNKQNITYSLMDMNFIFSCSTRFRFDHSKIKFISMHRHVIFLYVWHTPLFWPALKTKENKTNTAQAENRGSGRAKLA